MEVGNQFNFQIEMLMSWLHIQVQGGTNYISRIVCHEGIVATSIVTSLGYEEEEDFKENAHICL